ncbi:lipopolysaccharide biosynthesis protein [Thomasclavelia cocleata]|uniref:lipopolysaccharide biosynthesis protein n=2 Tax=Thomasclavelia cocleata TaxID=69824 RepID=UPI00242C3465|nr:oligosaccharide flippase family protein [Thomasclavelia cocleata]
MRAENTFRNLKVSTLAQLFNMFLSFISRTVFIHLLSTEYLGLSGLFTNVLSILALSDLGIGNAIIINLYKPLAEKDEDTICKYMNFYARAYRIIGTVIIVFGLITMPFLNYIVKTDTDIPNLYIIYFLYVLNSAISYFCAYKRSIITADQKEYMNVINRNVFLVLQNILQIIFLLITKNYIVYISIMVICTFLSNLKISQVANKYYPYLENNKSKLSMSEIKKLFRDLKAMMYHKFGNTIINSTDNIIISSFLGVFWVGLYSNYSMIIGIITTFALLIFSSASASIGNLNATENSEKVFFIFRVMQFLGVWVYGFCSLCFIFLLNPFIELWIGNKYVLDSKTMVIIVLAFCIKGVVSISGTFVDSLGLFWNTRYKPWIMALLNIFISIIGAQIIGLRGVFIGTIMSYCLTSLWVDPYVLYKYKFKIRFIEYGKYLGRFIVQFLLIFVILLAIEFKIKNFILRFIICIIVPNILFILLNIHTVEYNYLLSIVNKFIGSKLRYKLYEIKKRM